jgi:hypothetical protein
VAGVGGFEPPNGTINQQVFPRKRLIHGTLPLRATSYELPQLHRTSLSKSYPRNQITPPSNKLGGVFSLRSALGVQSTNAKLKII